MRPLLLAQAAMEAETLRLRYQIQRNLIRAVLTIIAIMLILGAILSGHFAAWYWLRESLARHHAALVVGGCDLLAAFILLTIAARSSPGRVEREALAVRRRALTDARHSMAFSVLLARLAAGLAAHWAR